MQKSKNEETSKQLELFLSEDYDKVIACLRSKGNCIVADDEDQQHDDIVGTKTNLRDRKYHPLQFQDRQESYSQVKIQQEDFNDQSPSQFAFSQSILESDSSNKSIQFIDSQSLAIETKVRKIKKEQVKKLTKSKKIKREKKGKSQKTTKKNQNEVKRKIRTTVSEEKIKILEHLFPYIEKKLPYRGTIINLKDIAKIVNLGYSTILHKYKDYRRKGNVQKGLLLKSKDVKRKYNKSLIIETRIKQALKERSFRTAKQLAVYLSQKHKLNVNRSIVSRHLNEMQREKKFEYVGHMIDSDQKNHKLNFNEYSSRLRQFSRIFMGLKNQKMDFLYMTVIRIYLVGGRIVRQLQDQQIPINIINLVVTATQTQLVFYYPTSPNKSQQIIQRRYSHQIKYSAFQTLYQQLLQKIDQKQIQVQNNNEIVYIVFPYEDKHKQYIYRQKVLKKLIDEKINVLVIPPRFNQQNANFIHKWFMKKVYKRIQNQHFANLTICKQYLMKAMNEEQKSLWDYSSEMISVIRKAQ